MTTRTNKGNKINWFLRKAYKDWPWSFWTVVAVLVATWIPAFIWPEMFPVILWVWGVILAFALFVLVVIKIIDEIVKNT